MTMMLAELNALRTKLFERVGKASPKKKRAKRPKRDRNAGDDQSVYSVATTVDTGNGPETQIFVGITEDYGWTINKRQYNNKTPTLTKIGVKNFDNQSKMTDLKFRLPRA